jgi:hypothetical protein
MTTSIRKACIVLGVNLEGLTLDIAKAAFRKRALESHPDKHRGDIASDDRMKEINGAWDAMKTYFGTSSTPPTPPPPPPASPSTSSASAACYYAAVFGDDHKGSDEIIGSMWTKKGGWKAVCAGCKAWLESEGNKTFKGLNSNQPEHAAPPHPPPSAPRVAKCSYAATYGEHDANSDSVGTIKTNKGRKPVCDACRKWLEAAGNTSFWSHDADS